MRAWEWGGQEGKLRFESSSDGGCWAGGSLRSLPSQVFGLGSVAHMVLGEQKMGSFLGVNLGFGFGVTMGVHVGGGISGE